MGLKDFYRELPEEKDRYSHVPSEADRRATLEYHGLRRDAIRASRKANESSSLAHIRDEDDLHDRAADEHEQAAQIHERAAVLARLEDAPWHNASAVFHRSMQAHHEAS